MTPRCPSLQPLTALILFSLISWKTSSKILISLPRGVHLQDLNNYNLNKDTQSGYGAPGGPISSYPLYRVHGGDLSPKPSTPTSPSILRSPTSPNHPSYGFVPISPIGGPVSPSAGHYGVYLDPQRLINKSPTDLPDGVDPTRKEVGAESRVKS